MPDIFAVLYAFVALALIAPWFFVEHFLVFAAGVVLCPFALLSVLTVQGGKVTHVKLVLFVPYWATFVPEISRFSLYQAWEDDHPSGVSFTMGTNGKNELHLGRASFRASFYGECAFFFHWINAERAGLAF